MYSYTVNINIEQTGLEYSQQNEHLMRKVAKKKKMN